MALVQGELAAVAMFHHLPAQSPRLPAADHGFERTAAAREYDAIPENNSRWN
jgi:hypothetical protein